MAKTKRITAKQKTARRKNIAIARKYRHSSAAGKAFKGAYKQVQRSTGGRIRKDYARRVGHTAAMKADMIGGKAIARKYARGVARKKLKMDAKGAKQFSRGYINSILNDLKRGA